MVTAIILVITGIIFTGQGSFNNSVILSSASYDIGLTMRNAATYGIGTRAQGGVANSGYGLEFKKGSPSAYSLFVDSSPSPGAVGACHPLPDNGATAPDAYPGDCVLGPGDTTVSTYHLANGLSVSKFCASTNGGSAWSCSTDLAGTVNQLDIVFVRPNATPFMSINGTYNKLTPVTNACLTVSSSVQSRYISISSSGQIIADATSCGS